MVYEARTHVTSFNSRPGNWRASCQQLISKGYGKRAVIMVATRGCKSGASLHALALGWLGAITQTRRGATICRRLYSRVGTGQINRGRGVSMVGKTLA